jgi:hypothetical protein
MSEILSQLSRKASAALALLALASCDSGKERSGIGVLYEEMKKPLHAPANLDLNDAGHIACSSAIFEGTVSRISLVDPGGITMTLKVRKWLKPETGPDQYTFEVDKLDDGVYGLEEWQQGDRVNILVDVDPNIVPYSLPDNLYKRVKEAADKARALECPYGPEENSN